MTEEITSSVVEKGTGAFKPEPKQYTPEQQEMFRRMILQKKVVPVKTVQKVAETGVFLPEKTPERFKKKVIVPQEIKSVGAIAEDVFVRYAYETRMGVDPYKTGTGQRLSYQLRKSRHWWETYAVFEGDKSWKDIQREEPALYLYRDPKTGVFSPQYDFKKWYYQEYRPLRKKKVGSVGAIAGDISYSFLNIFDVGTWTSAISGDLPSYHARKEYMNVRDIQAGKGLEVWARIQIPAYQTAILPMVTGAGLGAGLGLLKASSIGSKALIGAGSQALTISKAVKLGVTGAISYKIGESLLKEPVRTGISLAMSLPFAIFGFRAGYRFGAGYKPVVGYATDPYGNLVIQKHLISVFGKPLIKVGKPVALGATVGDTVAKIVSPIPSHGISSFQSAKTFLQQHGMQNIGSNIKSSMLAPYKPSGLASYQKLQYGYTSPVGEPMVYGSKWGEKLFVETGKDWQPKIKWGKLSTEVHRKPVVYGAYETFYRFIIISKKPLISLKKTNIISFKPTKHFSIKDVIKSDKKITKDLGDSSPSVSKTGTVTIQKTKTKTETITSLKEELVVPESLLKPVHKQVLQKVGLTTTLKKTSLFYGLKEAIKTKQESQLVNLLGIGLASESKQVQTIALKKALLKESAFALVYKQDTITVQDTGQITDQAKVVKNIPDYVYDFSPPSVYTSKIPHIDFIEDVMKTKAKKPRRLIEFDEPFGRKVEKFRMPKMIKLGYREREWKVAKIGRMLDLNKISKELKI